MDVMQLMPNPEANVPVASDVMECALMTLQWMHVRKHVFIDHTHWRSENEMAARRVLLVLSARSPREVTY